MYQISTKSGKVYNRVAWTGGDTPTKEQAAEKDFQELRSAFFRESLKDCGGLDFFKFTDKFWEKMNYTGFEWPEKIQFDKVGYYGTSCMERARTFWNRARLDAWRTLENHRKSEK